MGKHTITATVCDKRGRIISVGQNSYIKTHPLQAWAAKKTGEPHRIYLHAEVAALVKVRWNKAHSIFISRWDKDGNPLPAAPCAACTEVIKKAGINLVRYT